MSDRFVLRGTPLSPSELLAILGSGGEALDTYLAEEIYAQPDPAYLAAQRERFARTLRLHRERVGEAPTLLLRAPGRLNAFLEYLDMCAGDHMSTTIDGDIPVAVSPRGDDRVEAANVDPRFPPLAFSIRQELEIFLSAPWEGDAVQGLEDTWDHRTRVYPHYRRPKGDWGNYILSPYLRLACAYPHAPWRGASLTFGPSTIPLRAGTSSSSAVVVLSFLALWWTNREALPPCPTREICALLGEAEWYVGTHGGANDQMTILCNRPHCVLYNRHHLALPDSTVLPCLRGVRMIVANSLWEANKALGANHVFNLRKGWMDLGDDLMRRLIACVLAQRPSGPAEPGWLPEVVARAFPFRPEDAFPELEGHPEYWERIAKRYDRFGSLDETLLGIPDPAIEEFIRLLPEEISPEDAGRVLGEDRAALERDYTLPDPHEGGYRPRAAARFFHEENRIGRELERRLLDADRRLRAGEIDPDGPAYRAEKVWLGRAMEALQETARDEFRISNEQLERLLAIARRGPGYLGGKLTGAGSGGCVCILVEAGSEERMLAWLDREYYGRPGHFDRYRRVLQDLEARGRAALERAGGPAEAEAARGLIQAAADMRRNLERALADPSRCRRAVTFSRGACALALERFRP